MTKYAAKLYPAAIVAIKNYRRIGVVPSLKELIKITEFSAPTVSGHIKAAVKGGWLIDHGCWCYAPAHHQVVAAPLKTALEWCDPALNPSVVGPSAADMLSIALGGANLDDVEGHVACEISRAWSLLASEKSIPIHQIRDRYEADGVLDPLAWQAADLVLTEKPSQFSTPLPVERLVDIAGGVAHEAILARVKARDAAAAPQP